MQRVWVMGTFGIHEWNTVTCSWLSYLWAVCMSLQHLSDHTCASHLRCKRCQDVHPEVHVYDFKAIISGNGNLISRFWSLSFELQIIWDNNVEAVLHFSLKIIIAFRQRWPYAIIRPSTVCRSPMVIFDRFRFCFFCSIDIRMLHRTATQICEMLITV